MKNVVLSLTFTVWYLSCSLGGDLIGRQVVFENGNAGVVVTHRPPLAFVYTDMDSSAQTEGAVTVYDSLAMVDVPEGIQSSDCFGRSKDSESSEVSMKRPIFAPIPKVSDIALINSPIVTGVTMFDALAPIGNGQNMLMVGHDIEDMRKYVCDILSVQNENTKCIYAATSDQESVSEMLNKAGVMDNVVFVSDEDDADTDNASKAAKFRG